MTRQTTAIAIASAMAVLVVVVVAALDEKVIDEPRAPAPATGWSRPDKGVSVTAQRAVLTYPASPRSPRGLY